MPGAHETPTPAAPPAADDASARTEGAGRPEIKHPADKVRIRFRKSGALRLLSHHDLLRTFERLLRRSELPFHRSQGFHPKPRLVFALSLPLGVVGREEVVELELDQVLPPEEIHARLARQTPPGLDILSVRRISPKINAQVCRLAYAVAVPAERLPELSRRIADVLAARECWVDRNRPHSRQAGRRLDVRPFLADLRTFNREERERDRDGERETLPVPVPHPDPVPDLSGPRTMLEMTLRLTPAGTARPEEVLGLLGLEDLLDAGAVLERTRLELSDELEKGSHEKRDAD